MAGPAPLYADRGDGRADTAANRCRSGKTSTPGGLTNDHLKRRPNLHPVDARSQIQPDIVCLQELKAPQDRFPEAAIRDVGYQSIWRGRRSWNGVAILSRRGNPIEIRHELPGEPEDQQSR